MREDSLALVPVLRNHPGSVNPIIKSNNLLNNAIAMQEANRRRADEGLMCNYRGELTEWYLNSPLGVEQGFTLERAPKRTDGEPLTIAFILSGDLTRRAMKRRSFALR